MPWIWSLNCRHTSQYNVATNDQFTSSLSYRNHRRLWYSGSNSRCHFSKVDTPTWHFTFFAEDWLLLVQTCFLWAAIFLCENGNARPRASIERKKADVRPQKLPLEYPTVDVGCKVHPEWAGTLNSHHWMQEYATSYFLVDRRMSVPINLYASGHYLAGSDVHLDSGVQGMALEQHQVSSYTWLLWVSLWTWQ